MDPIAESLNLALEHHRAGRNREAESVCREIIRAHPRQPEALHLLGLNAHLAGRHEEAVRVIGEAIAANGASPDFHNNLGEAHRALGDAAEAEAGYRGALALDADFVAAYLNLGILYSDQGRTAEAIGMFEAALARKPDYAAALHGLGMALAAHGRHADGVARLRESVLLDASNVSASLNLAMLLEQGGQLDEALAIARRVMRDHPENADAEGELLRYAQQACDWDGIERLWERQRQWVRSRPGVRVLPWWFMTGPGTAEEQLACATNWTRSQFVGLARRRSALNFRFDRTPGAKLRIGYASADFYEHATAYLLAELFELHLRTAFEVHAYSFGPDDRSPVRARLARACDCFSDVALEPFEQTARRIHRDEIDILVDLKGYTARARPQIFALRPAPLQISYLGYPGTMGADFIDYIVTDAFVTPPGMEPCFAERLACLPDCYQINDRRRPIAQGTPARRQAGLPEAGFVFCCFNNSFKITPALFGVWGRILQRVPGSVLWLLASHGAVVANLRREAAATGIDPDRLVFAPRVPLAEHLARHRLADLGLDTFPCNGHTTTSDALWAGLPVLTYAGNTFVSRVAGSLLRAAELPDLVVNSIGEYETRAVDLAGASRELAQARVRLAENRLRVPLFDSEQCTRHIESAFRMMWDARLRGEAPRRIDVPRYCR